MVYPIIEGTNIVLVEKHGIGLARRRSSRRSRIVYCVVLLSFASSSLYVDV